MRNGKERKRKMDEYNNVIIELESGEAIEYSVMAVFEIGGCSYVALLPVDESKSDEIVFYGCNEKMGEKELELIAIEDEEEFSVVSEAFIKLMEDYSNTEQE